MTASMYTSCIEPNPFVLFILEFSSFHLRKWNKSWISLLLLNLAFSRSATTLYLQQCEPVCGLNEYTDHDLFYTLNLDRPLTFKFLLKARHIKGIHIFPARGSRSFGCNTQISPCVDSLKQGVSACTWVCMRAYFRVCMHGMASHTMSTNTYDLEINMFANYVYGYVCVHTHIVEFTNCKCSACLWMSASISKTRV